jgi:hypothetical protein
MTKLGRDRIAPLSVRVSPRLRMAPRLFTTDWQFPGISLKTFSWCCAGARFTTAAAKLHSFGKSASPGYGVPLSSRTCLHTVSNSVFAADLCGSSYK